MGELLALRWRDVDFAGSVVRVCASYYAGHLTTPTSGKVRTVPLAPDVASALAQLGQRRDWVRDDDLVFAGAGGDHLDGSALRRRYRPDVFGHLQHTRCVECVPGMVGLRECVGVRRRRDDS